MTDSRYPTARNGPADRDTVFTAVLLVLSFAYVCSFWGQAARLLPPPIDSWHDLYYRRLATWWHAAIGASMPAEDATALYHAVEAFVLGLLVPIIALGIGARRPSDAGLRMPAPGTTRVGLALALPALLAGFLLAAVTKDPWGSAVYESLELAAMLPEHFLIFGVVMGLALPGRRLSRQRNPRNDTIKGTPEGRFGDVLRLNNREAFAVAAAGVLFQLAHVGVSDLELFVALPMGLLFAYATLCTESIWPALVGHWALNLCPLAVLGLRGATA